MGHALAAINEAAVPWPVFTIITFSETFVFFTYTLVHTIAPRMQNIPNKKGFHLKTCGNRCSHRMYHNMEDSSKIERVFKANLFFCAVLAIDF